MSQTRLRSVVLAVLCLTFAALSAQAQFGDLAVFKTGPAEANAGTDVAYDVTITNVGADPASTVQLNDPIPPGMTFVSRTQNSGVAFACTDPGVGNGGNVNCTTATMLAGESANFTFVFNIPPATPAGTYFTNIATASAQPVDDYDENDSGVATTSTPPAPSADMVISKSGPTSAAPGTDVQYTIAVTNGGPSTAANVSWSDLLPGDMTFVSLVQNAGPTMTCGTPGSGSGGTITCNLASFPASQTATFTLTTQVPLATIATSYQNTATVTTTTSDPSSENNSSTTLLAVSSVDVSVVKTGPATAAAGASVSYTVTVTNAGPNTAADVELSDSLPAGTTFVSITQDSGPASSCSTPGIGTNGTVVCSIPILAIATPTQFTLVLNSGSAVSIVNTATVTTSSYDTNNSNNSSTAITSVTQSADLGVTKTGPGSVSAGGSITYTVTATNNGPSNASTVSLTDTLPPNTTFVSATQTSGPPFNCTPPAVGGTGTITCNIATFAASATATFTFVFNVSPAATGSIANTANISAATADPSSGNNGSTTTATIGQSADLSVNKTGPAAVTAGSNITYTVTAANAGPSSAANVSLTDVLPPNTTFVSATQTSGPAFICATPAVGSPGTITCTAATFAPGVPAVFSFVVNLAPTATGTVSNTAAITSTTPDPTPGNSSSGITSGIGAGPIDVSITKTASAASYTLGSNATFTLTVTNNGPGNAFGTTVTDVLPAGTTFVSATPTQGSCTGTTTVVCTIGTLAPAATATITLVVHLPQTVGPISNTATVTIANTETAPANNTSTAAINVIAEIPALSPLALVLLAMMLAGAGVVMKR